MHPQKLLVFVNNFQGQTTFFKWSLTRSKQSYFLKSCTFSKIWNFERSVEKNYLRKIPDTVFIILCFNVISDEIWVFEWKTCRKGGCYREGSPIGRDLDSSENSNAARWKLWRAVEIFISEKVLNLSSAVWRGASSRWTRIAHLVEGNQTL